MTPRLAAGRTVAAISIAVVAAMSGTAFAKPANNLKCAGCVTSKHVADGKIKAKDLAGTAQPSGGRYAQSSKTQDVPDVIEVVLSKHIVAPSDGYVVATTSFIMIGANGAVASCRIARKAGNYDGPEIYFAAANSPTITYQTISRQTTFKVKKGKVGVHLNCADSANDVKINDLYLGLLFYPNKY